MRTIPAIAALLLPFSLAPAITIELDYSLDTNGFFDQQERRDALEAATDFYAGVISDSLAEIKPFGANSWELRFNHPGTGDPTTVVNPTLPADTIRIYVGGYEITGDTVGIGGPGGWGASAVDASWFDTIEKRGTPDGGTADGTDFTPWGGTLAFDTSVSWNFSLTSPSVTQTNFISIALHELGHVLGIGTSAAWQNLINFDNATFDGPQTMARYGQGVPVSGNTSHFLDDNHCSNASPGGFDPDNWRNVLSDTLAMFGTPAGITQIVIMDPSNCGVGAYLKVLTEVDLAALDDIGWDVTYPPSEPAPIPVLAASTDPGMGTITVSFQSAAAHTYQFQESQNLTAWTPVGPMINGDDTIKSFTATTQPTTRNQYRLQIDPAAPAPLPSPAQLVAPPRSPKPGLLQLLTASRPPRTCSYCNACTTK
ncbi:MAG: hypothetical protein P8J87_05120 [Verrucomicrobiales bacterium]|nr:hypothetical protein [Verrucomicrobiales bacterium]